MFLTVILFFFQAVSNRTPHVDPSATPYPETINHGFPFWGWILIAAIAILAVIFRKRIVAFFKSRFTTSTKHVHRN